MNEKLDLNEIRSSAEAGFVFRPITVLALLARLEQAEQLARINNQAMLEQTQRAGQAEQQVARVRGAVGKLRKAVEDIQTDDPGLESYSHNRSRGAGYQIASNLVDRALDGES